MLKADVIKYLAVDNMVRNKGNKILTEILNCSNATVSKWDKHALIPVCRAIELHAFFSKKANRLKYNLSADYPRFVLLTYIGEDGRVINASRAGGAGGQSKSFKINDWEVGKSRAAVRILNRVDKVKSYERKAGILEKFIESLIKDES